MVIKRQHRHDDADILVLNRNKALLVGRTEEETMDLTSTDPYRNCEVIVQKGGDFSRRERQPFQNPRPRVS